MNAVRTNGVIVTVRVPVGEYKWYYADLDTAVKVLQACLTLPDNKITGWAIDESETEPCPHNTLFATGAPPASAGDQAYTDWLYSTRHCRDCGADVENRNL